MKSKIKIAYIIDSINSVAGTEKQLLETIKRLNKERFEVTLICLREPSATFQENWKQFKYVELDIKSIFSLKGVFGIFRLAYYLRSEGIDIIQTLFFDANVIGVLAGKIAGIKVIIASRRDMGFWYTSRLLKVLRVINKMTTRILANSYAVKENVSKYEKVSENKIDVIRNGLDMDLFNKQISNRNLIQSMNMLANKHTVGIVANLNRPVKRVDVFISMASEVLTIVNNVYFEIVGDGNLRNDLEDLTRKLGISDRVIFLGRKTDIKTIIEKWDIGVLSSDSEGFSNSILEYMGVGLPVVATETGGNGEVVEDGVNGFLVPSGDYKAMAEKIICLLKNPEKRIEMSRNAKGLIQKEYIWPIKIMEIESYYYNLLKRYNSYKNDTFKRK